MATDSITVGVRKNEFLDDEQLTFGDDEDYKLFYDIGEDLLELDDANDNALWKVSDTSFTYFQQLDVNSNDIVDGGTTVWDTSAGYVPKSSVEGGGVWSGENLDFEGTGSDTTVTLDGTFDLIFENDGGSNVFAVRESSLVEVLNSDLRIPTGQAIEDGSGTARYNFASDQTKIFDESGRRAFRASDAGGDVKIFADSTHPFQLQDDEGNFIAVQYDTDATAGVLRTPNSGFAVEARYSNFPQAGATNISFDVSNEKGEIFARHTDGTQYTTLQLGGDPIEMRGLGGLIDMSVDGADLRLSTGQAIEDGSGTERFSLDSGETSVYSEGGSGSNPQMRLDAGNNTVQITTDNGKFLVRDGDGGFDAYQYFSSASPTGTLELTNADLDANDNLLTDVKELRIFSANNGVSWPDQGGGTRPLVFVDGSGEVIAGDDDGNTTQLT